MKVPFDPQLEHGLIDNNCRLIRRYLRLQEKWFTIPVEVTMTEVAEVMICSTRYARKLLLEMRNIGWLSWTSSPGRGARGLLCCRLTRDALSVMNEGKYPLQLNRSTLNTQDKQRICCEPTEKQGLYVHLYRSLGSIVPSKHVGFHEREILSIVHAGLTRIDSTGIAVPDVAHTMVSLNNGSCWKFYLRDGLYWHDGSVVTTDQLLFAFKQHLPCAEIGHIVRVELSGHCLTIILSRPDAMLPYKLANPIYALAKPGKEECGLGSFRINNHSDTKLILERFIYCHRTLPLISQITFKFLEHKSESWRILKMYIKGNDDGTQTHVSDQESGFWFLAFNECRRDLSDDQKKIIRLLARQASQMVQKKAGVLPPSLTSFDKELASYEAVRLPTQLSMTYLWKPDSEVFVLKFQQLLQYYHCQLNVQPVSAANWFLQGELDTQDMGISFFRYDFPVWMSVETYLRDNPLISKFITDNLKAKIDRFLRKIDVKEKNYPRYVMKLMKIIQKNGWLYPLFLTRFIVLAPERIKNVIVSPQGWPDFSRLWIS